MKTIRILILIYFLFTAYIQSIAQETEYYDNIQKEIAMGKELFE